MSATTTGGDDHDGSGAQPAASVESDGASATELAHALRQVHGRYASQHATPWDWRYQATLQAFVRAYLRGRKASDRASGAFLTPTPGTQLLVDAARAIALQAGETGVQPLLATFADSILACHDRGLHVVMCAREDAMVAARQHGDDADTAALLGALSNELKRVLACMVGAATLELRHITWDETPASVLDYVAHHEVVHPTKVLTRFRRRLGPGRRCYGLFHGLKPIEPFAFVHVALTPTIAGTLSDLGRATRAPDAEDAATTAMFYSITVPRPCFKGLDLAGMLLQRVMPALGSEMPGVTQFSTLSPMPLFLRWWHQSHTAPGWVPCMSDQDGATVLGLLAEAGRALPSTSGSTAARAEAAVLALLQDPDAQWHRSPALCESAEFRDLVLTTARRYVSAPDACPVARFHCSHGAMPGEVHWLGNVSAKGMAESAGVMVNYEYITAAAGGEQELQSRQAAYFQEG